MKCEDEILETLKGCEYSSSMQEDKMPEEKETSKHGSFQGEDNNTNNYTNTEETNQFTPNSTYRSNVYDPEPYNLQSLPTVEIIEDVENELDQHKFKKFKTDSIVYREGSGFSLNYSHENKMDGIDEDYLNLSQQLHNESTISDSNLNPNCYHTENFLDVDTPGRFRRTNNKLSTENLSKKVKIKIKIRLCLAKLSASIKFPNKTSRNCKSKFLGKNSNSNSNQFNDFLDEN